jgi:aspartyl-tRNA(Asn)/glutamyl-tRNA(Gln) amidotransferase subunit B
VSVRRRGADKLGTKAEVKNLNSFRFVKQAIDVEVARQVAVIESGGRVVQETRLYVPDSGETVGMRSKEEAHDYRYFPEPDLLPLRVSTGWRRSLADAMPELPPARRKRYVEQLGLRDYDAQVLTQSREISEYFDRAAEAAGDDRLAANWVMGDLAAMLKAESIELARCPIPPAQLGELVALVAKGELSGKLAKEIFAKMWTTGESAPVIAEREGLRQISDTGAIEKAIDEAIAANPKQVEQYRGGKTAVLGFLVGQVMKATRGQANPQLVNDLFRKRLQALQ